MRARYGYRVRSAMLSGRHLRRWQTSTLVWGDGVNATAYQMQLYKIFRDLGWGATEAMRLTYQALTEWKRALAP